MKFTNQWCNLSYFAVVNKIFMFYIPQLKLTRMRLLDFFDELSYLCELCLHHFLHYTGSCTRI